jgi:hypothetical protein
MVASRTQRNEGATAVIPRHDTTHPQAVELCRTAWTLTTQEVRRLLVRGVRTGDFAALATFHGRCSGQTLLQRYRNGGLAPSLPALHVAMREPLLLAVLSAPGHVVALGSAAKPDPADCYTSEIGLVVEDGFQGQGIGSRLALHLAASLRMMGTGQLVTRSASPSLPLHSVMSKIGPTRVRTGPGACSELVCRIQVRGLEGLGPDLARATGVRGMTG